MGKIKYCPRCGELYGYEHFDEYSGSMCECMHELKMFDFAERKKTKLIETDHDVKDWERPKGIPQTLHGLTQEIYEFFWGTYVDIPENDKLNREAFEQHKAHRLEFFAKGGYAHVIPPASYATGSNSKKDASVVGRAVVGGVIAGPAGAVVGAASAIDKNLKNKK